MNSLLTDNQFCTSCAACENVCPKDAISMHLDKNGFLRPIVNEVKCIHCGLCEKKCPIKKKVTSPNCNYEVPFVYAAFTKDAQIRIKSSSGGLFSVLATEILKQNGAVIGVAQQRETNFKHTIIRSEKELQLLRGSKYVQASPGLIYRETKKLLQENIKVLFSGTPCQIAALYSYLGERHYENLWTIDVVCHGTPSFNLFLKYIHEIEARVKGKVVRSQFRDKSKGWANFSMSHTIQNQNGHNFQEFHPLQEDLFLRLFLSNICLNESCHDCKYNGIPRLADITLGDFWGVKRFHPEMDDNMGTSVVLVNNSKGMGLFNQIKADIIFCKSELNKAINNNPCIIRSYPKNQNSDKFFADIICFSINDLQKKYCNQ